MELTDLLTELERPGEREERGLVPVSGRAGNFVAMCLSLAFGQRASSLKSGHRALLPLAFWASPS